jgi:hypothetical protein
MSTSIYTTDTSASTPDYATANNVTIALSYNKLLTKTIYPGGEKAYDNAYYYKFFNRNVHSLGDLLELAKVLLARPNCCLIRGVCKDDSVSKQRRLFHGDDATIIEQPQNWFALDIDGYGNSSGCLKDDTKSVLLALGLNDTEAFAIPSAGYLRKPGIRIRLFLWNSIKVSCASLKKHFTPLKHVVDLALFHPIQPIYTARPIFISSTDPCKELVAWVSGEKQFTMIKETNAPGAHKEELYTKKQAERFLNNFIMKCFTINDGERHSWLYGVSIALGKWIYQELLDEEDVVEQLYLATRIWRGNKQKDMQTILDGIKYGKRTMEEQAWQV